MSTTWQVSSDMKLFCRKREAGVKVPEVGMVTGEWEEMEECRQGD